MNSKPWYMSKTVWVNAIGLAIAIAAGVGVSDATVTLYVGLLLPPINIALRAVTKESITITAAEIGVKNDSAGA